MARSEMRERRRSGTSTEASFYGEVLKTLRRRGVKRSPEMTPAEFSQAAAGTLGPESTEALGTVTEAFCRLRYGRQALTEADRQEVVGAMERIDLLCKSRRARRKENNSKSQI